MSHFAEIDQNGTVLRVIVADQEFIDSGAVGNPANWVQTSYNTSEGIHKEGGEPIRKNYAGVGYTYDAVLDAFIPPKAYDSFSLDTQKGTWVAPKEIPKDGKDYDWDEQLSDWKEIATVEVIAEEVIDTEPK